jgi:hypothetical protein
LAVKPSPQLNLHITQNMPRHKYFAEKTKDVFSTDALIVPETAMNLRNDCKEGKWFLGETEYGSKLKFICLKFSRRIATDEYGAISPGTPLGQLWFCPVAAGESPNGQPLPTNVVYYTLVKNSSSGKSGSLINFGQKAVLAQSQGYDYREVVWSATFKKKSATIDGEAVSYYVLDFEYSEPDEAALKRVDQAVAVLESQEDMQKLFDPALEAATQCVDGLKPEAIAQLVENLRANRAALPAA